MQTVELWQVGVAWLLVLLPFVIFGIAGAKWGTYTSNYRGLDTSLDV